MRYYWDLYYYLYYGAKVGSVRPETWLQLSHSAPGTRACSSRQIWAIIFRKTVPISGNHSSVRVPVQHMGPNLRQSEESHGQQGPLEKHLVDGLEALVRKCARKRGRRGWASVGNMHFLWLGPTPYPKCPTAECKNRRRFNNHYAADAVMMRFTRAFRVR